MEFIHYSQEPLEYWRPISYIHWPDYKPAGMWFSVENIKNHEDDQTWKTWCESEEFSLHRLKYKHRLELSEDANLLLLNTSKKMLDFTKNYGKGLLTKIPRYLNYVNWPEVVKIYDGIAIYPYFWQFRLESPFAWYYPWDCASGCIWNMKIVKNLSLITTD